MAQEPKDLANGLCAKCNAPCGPWIHCAGCRSMARYLFENYPGSREFPKGEYFPTPASTAPAVAVAVSSRSRVQPEPL